MQHTPLGNKKRSPDDDILSYREVLHEQLVTVESNDALTFGDDPLQPDDVWVIELTHDARLAQKITPLLL